VTRPAPDLPPRLLEPKGLRWGKFTAADGSRLRWAFLGAATPVLDCVLVGGFSEFIEKYFETIADLAARGFAVWCLDWRGQGGSVRPRWRSARPQARDFDRDAADLAAFAAGIEGNGVPRVVVAHSMGAAVALLAMRAHPRLFDAAVLSAPMLALATGRTPPDRARRIAAAARKLGLGRTLVPGTRTWPVDVRRGPERSKTSGDSIRCRVQPAWYARRGELRVAGVTFEWLERSLDLCRRFEDPGLLARIRAPVLLGSAGVDHFVDVAAHRRAAMFLPNCRHVVFPHAKHELFMEADELRDRWLAEIDRFVLDTLAPAAASRRDRQGGPQE
jgi:lysophospholipase